MSFFDKLLDDISEESINTLHKSVKFVAGESQIPVTGKVFGKEEIKNANAFVKEFLTYDKHLAYMGHLLYYCSIEQTKDIR